MGGGGGKGGREIFWGGGKEICHFYAEIAKFV